MGAINTVAIAELPLGRRTPAIRSEEDDGTLVVLAVNAQPGAREPRATLFGYEPGNEADFERLYKASYGKILASLTVVLGDRSAAEDCAQDAFERAYRKWPTWQPVAPPEAWVHRIAINAAISYQRKRRIREVDQVIRRLGVPVDRDQGNDRDLATALAQLPARQAAAIVLRHYHGYTNRAIAHSLGVPEGTVASRVRGARARLRAMLA
ncbi:MAG: RNA polymerase sigma factor [Candidatus Dormibacteraeota bacterium]|nr:RNA polymerase sigma factor [Candidatus Dormibacteraeota bacterium]